MMITIELKKHSVNTEIIENYITIITKRCGYIHRAEYTNNWYPADFPCYSYKAAIRHLRKHDEIPKGTRFLLVSRFVGCDRVLIKR